MFAALLSVGCARAEAPPTTEAVAEAASKAATPPASTAGQAAVEAAEPYPGRVVAVADLHGDLDATRAVLRMVGVLGEGDRWTGGQTVLVQTGDTTDRGPDSKGVIKLIAALGPQAEAAGGRVVALLGNHEAMNIQGDWRYVSPQDVAGFGSVQARKTAFSPDGELGQWLRNRDVVAQVGDTVFVHGGLSTEWTTLGLDAVNNAARAALDKPMGADEVLGSSGPLWLRPDFSGRTDPKRMCADLKEALDALGARRLVVGHTVQPDHKVAVRCGGALLGADTGISAHYGGHLAAVEILAGDARAIYDSGVVDLPDPDAQR